MAYEEVIHELRSINSTLRELIHATFNTHRSIIEGFAMLTKSEQDLIAAVNASGNKVAAAITAGSKTISDILASNGDAELTAAIQPILDNQSALADALLKQATDADPAVNPTAPPLVIPTPPASTL